MYAYDTTPEEIVGRLTRRYQDSYSDVLGGVYEPLNQSGTGCNQREQCRGDLRQIAVRRMKIDPCRHPRFTTQIGTRRPKLYCHQ